jgi:hypothetical protein
MRVIRRFTTGNIIVIAILAGLFGYYLGTFYQPTLRVAGPMVDVPGPTVYVDKPGPTVYVDRPGPTVIKYMPGKTKTVRYCPANELNEVEERKLR